MNLRTLIPACLISMFLPFSTAIISSALAEEPVVTVEELPPALAPLPLRSGYSTLPGWSGGYRYNFDADANNLNSVRLFLKRKTVAGHTLKVAWQRQTGVIPNFFKTGTIDGVSFSDVGTFYIEQEIKF